MKNYIFTLLLLSGISGYSQKKTSFYNERFEAISETTYRSQIGPGKLDLCFENDSLVVCVIVNRKNHGQLDQKDFLKLKSSLSPNQDLNNELIVIIYYPGKDKCNDITEPSGGSFFDRDYMRKLKRIASVDHFWIYKDDENLHYYQPNEGNWQADKDKLVEQLFFKLHYPCFSTVVIDSKGNYIANFGEFGKTLVWDISKELMARGQ